MKWLLISFVAVFCLFAACKKKGSPYSIIPHITYEGMNKDSIKAGSSEDSLIIKFHFTDGDADLGNDISSGKKDIFLIDSRDTSKLFTSFYFPDIDASVKDPDRGLDGDCIFSLPAAFVQARDSIHQVTGDTLHYIIYIKDVAGHESNRISTPDVYVRP